MTQTHDTSDLPITLETIAQQKAKLRQQIQQRKDTMTILAKEIVAPVAPATGKAGLMMRAFNTGMAAFDGVMLGLKIIKRMRKLFH